MMNNTPATHTTDDRTMAMLAHAMAYLLPLLGPMLMLVLVRRRSIWLEGHIKAAFNFHASLALQIAVLLAISYGLSVVILASPLVANPSHLSIDGVLVLFVSGALSFLAVGLLSVPLVMGAVLPIFGMVSASRGQVHVYPLTRRWMP